MTRFDISPRAPARGVFSPFAGFRGSTATNALARAQFAPRVVERVTAEVKCMVGRLYGKRAFPHQQTGVSAGKIGSACKRGGGGATTVLCDRPDLGRQKGPSHDQGITRTQM
jgi:hypothetical protein